MRKELNAEEIAQLAPYEKQMRTATEARWVSHIPQSGIDTFLAVWKSLTEQDRIFRQGCGTCILNLVYDLGVLYFKAKKKDEEKAAALKAEQERKAAEEAAAKAQAEAEAAAQAEAEAEAAADAAGGSEKPNNQEAEEPAQQESQEQPADAGTQEAPQEAEQPENTAEKPAEGAEAPKTANTPRRGRKPANEANNK